MEEKKLTLEEIKEQMEQKVIAYNKGVTNDIATSELNKIDIELVDLEKKYALAKSQEVYAECIATDNPIKTAITMRYYEVIKHKDDKKDGVIIGRQLTEREQVIDLFKLCKYCNDRDLGKKLPVDWVYAVEKLNMLLTLKIATELETSKDRLKEIASTYYMSKTVDDILKGKTPTSNTQCVKLLQECIDKIIYEPVTKKDKKDAEFTENSIKATVADINYILDLYCKKSKEDFTVQTAKHDFFRRLITEVIYKIMTGKVYNTEFKVKKTKIIA